jgi:hypothetical protein
MLEPEVEVVNDGGLKLAPVLPVGGVEGWDYENA